MDFVVPGVLGSLPGFMNEYADPIKDGQQHSATLPVIRRAKQRAASLAAIIKQ
jgi:hypothetical protein